MYVCRSDGSATHFYKSVFKCFIPTLLSNIHWVYIYNTFVCLNRHISTIPLKLTVPKLMFKITLPQTFKKSIHTLIFLYHFMYEGLTFWKKHGTWIVDIWWKIKNKISHHVGWGFLNLKALVFKLKNTSINHCWMKRVKNSYIYILNFFTKYLLSMFHVFFKC